MIRDHRDLCIEVPAASEAELIERVADLVADLRVYRKILQIAIHQLATVTRERGRARQVVYAVRDAQRKPQAA
jgi:hypothetical protein